MAYEGRNLESKGVDLKKVLITGIAGQDGSYLAELLVDKDFEVHGIIRRNSTPEHQESRIHHLSDTVTTHYGDLTDKGSIYRVISDVKPDFIFNLAAQSHVRISFDLPEFTTAVNATGALNLFEAVRQVSPNSRVYQASSSEMFGTSIDEDGWQRESTPMHPASPYGCAKLYAYHASRTYRDSYNLFISNGILFNHESPRRGSNFVTTKVVRGAISIKKGETDHLNLGNIDSYRDWGHSRDYVQAMLRILEHDKPDDFVIATGQTQSVRTLCELVFGKLGLDWNKYVKFDERLLRPKEVPILRGDAKKARQTLSWEPSVSFEQLIDEMVSELAKKDGLHL